MVLTRWVGAALIFALVWVVAMHWQLVAWLGETVAGIFRGQRPEPARLTQRVVAAHAACLGWLRRLAGWDDAPSW
jgi:hypothetical protein